MSLDKLIKDGKIVLFKATKEEVKRALKIAERDLIVAKATFDKSLDWCFSICYNAYLQTCRAYMFSLGYRSTSYQSHKTTIEFMEYTLDES